MTRLSSYTQLGRTQKLDAQLDEIDRELAMRRRNYPKWVASKSMSAEAAAYQIKLMEEVKETVRLARVDSMMRGMNGRRIDEEKPTPSAIDR